MEGALHGSCFWWKQNQVNKFADVKDIRGATKRINGGVIGLKERTDNYNLIYKIL